MLLNGTITADTEAEEAVSSLFNRLRETKSSQRGQATAALWLQYMDLIDILQQFIMAERTGHWELYLSAMQDTIPYLAAAGHNLYTKSIQVYLQNMLQLEQSNPDVYHSFTAGKHAIRRSDHFWAGLSTDLVIEQVLMRSIKTTGGLTRGRGMTESQRATWLLSMPACADVNGAMQQTTDSLYTTSEQHKDLCVSRKEQDDRDMKLMLAFLEDTDPFSDSSVLKNIATGVVAGPCVNAHKAKEVSEHILKKMAVQKIMERSHKCTDQAATMASKNSVKIDRDVVHVDPRCCFNVLCQLLATSMRTRARSSSMSCLATHLPYLNHPGSSDKQTSYCLPFACFLTFDMMKTHILTNCVSSAINE